MKEAPSHRATAQSATSGGLWRFLSIVAWGVDLCLVGCAAYLGWQVYEKQADNQQPVVLSAQIPLPTLQPVQVDVALPELKQPETLPFIPRLSSLHTVIPSRENESVNTYFVSKGDSLFQISSKFKIKPETILWANTDLLNDNPDMVSIGMELKVPPIDGVYYKWKDGDTLQGVAAQFKATPDAILNWAANDIDLVDLKVDPGSWVLIPGGRREFKQWIIPTISRGKRTGVSASVYGGGACPGGYDGAVGSGNFTWPAANHSVSGNDYWDGHLGIDISANEGDAVFAADSGVVVFAGFATGGYGYMIMLDHGNGYQTLYAHLSAINASCGQSVSRGSVIGAAGSTGNSTGPHLHFEVRNNGGFVNPWYVLPG